MFFILILLLLKLAHQASGFGVNYGRMGDNLPAPGEAVQLLLRNKISRVRLYDTDPGVISAFASSGIDLAVSTYNEEIFQLASGPEQASLWFNSNLLPHISSTNITTILLGNEILTRADPALSRLLVPALRNLHGVLVSNRVDNRVKLTTSHAMDVLDFSKSYPPSAGTFKPGVSEVMKPLLDFLAETNSPFFIDAYPYFAYRDDRGEHVELAYALLDRNSKGVKDWKTGARYSTLLEAQVDTVYAAIGKVGDYGERIRVVVGETGWPSVGEASNFGAGLENAEAFVNNLMELEKSGAGTPLRPGIPVQAYLFALFNENLKPGSTAERNFGLFHPNMTQVYHVDFL